MSLIKDNFYNIFWENQSCRNLFLLSKEELLETIDFGIETSPYSYTSNRIIISNIQDSNDNEFDAIKYRNEHYTRELDISIEDRIEHFKPIFENFFEKHLKKPLDKLVDDFDKKGWRLIFKVLKLFVNEETSEQKLIELLQEYGFIGKHLNSFKQVGDYVEGQLLPKKSNELVNEQNIYTFFEGIKFIKEQYVNNSYRRLYNTNQVLVNTLNSEDNFESRLKLFRLLYDGKIILPSKEDAFIECSNCEPGTYRGVFQLKINPKKLKDLKCPVCSGELTYFIPYELDNEIYNIVKEKDGLLLNALANKLESYGFEYQLNKKFLGNIEIDCIYDALLDNIPVTYVVEAKMFKLNTSKRKLKNKIKKYYGLFIDDIERLKKLDEFKSKWIKPLLLVNVTDNDLIAEINNELRLKNPNPINQDTDIMNLEFLQFRNN